MDQASKYRKKKARHTDNQQLINIIFN